MCLTAATASNSTRASSDPLIAQKAYVLPAAERSLLTRRWAVRSMFKKSLHLAFV